MFYVLNWEKNSSQVNEQPKRGGKRAGNDGFSVFPSVEIALGGESEKSYVEKSRISLLNVAGIQIRRLLLLSRKIHGKFEDVYNVNSPSLPPFFGIFGIRIL